MGHKYSDHSSELAHDWSYPLLPALPPLFLQEATLLLLNRSVHVPKWTRAQVHSFVHRWLPNPRAADPVTGFTWPGSQECTRYTVF